MEGDYEELYKCIKEHAITRPKRNINRDFADALPLCEILKQHYPKLVDIHNYTPKNSYSQKLINWETLNNKVLKKLKIILSKKRIDALDKGEPGAIEKLLLKLKRKIEIKASRDDSCEVIYLEGNAIAGKSPSERNKRTISIGTFEKMQSDLIEKSEAVEILKNKVDHLKNLLSIKEERIKDLSVQLQTIVNQSTRPDSAQGSKFFGFFHSSGTVNDPLKCE